MSIVVKKFGTLAYLAAENIAAPHGFTTRLGGVSEGHWASLNLGAHRGDKEENVAENFRRLGNAIGFSPEQLVLTHQIHTDIVRVVTKSDCLGSLSHRDYPPCDGLVTNTPGVALMVFSADCTPILLWDSRTGAVGAAHAGWRGTALGIAAKAVDAMVYSFGCRREDICAAVGPNIGVCCFETDGDVPEAMIAALGDEAKPYIFTEKSKYFVDLKSINALWLRRSGVTDITISTDCTACQPDRYWSHRVTSGNRGSQGAVILCKEGRK